MALGQIGNQLHRTKPLSSASNFLIKEQEVCPNYCRKDMGGESAPYSAEEGAYTEIWLATPVFISGTD